MSEASRARVGGARTDRAALLPACSPLSSGRARFTRLKITRESASVVHEQATGTAGARTTPSRHRRVAIRRIEPNFHANFARRDAVAPALPRGEVSMGEHDSGENQKTSLRSVRRAGVTCRHPYGHVHVHAVISGILYVISKTNGLCAIPGSGSLHASVPHGIRSAAHV